LQPQYDIFCSAQPPTAACCCLQTKLSNPHYKPEIAAQTTLVNFCVTEKGLEDQLLALVVDHERPDLQEQAGALVRQLAEYTITLKELEDSLLFRLANAQVGCERGC
jgi:dynein heavy chain